jgi:hypothetical protein
MFCFLGISNRGDIIPGIIVLPKYIRKANDLMIELDKLWDGFDLRRFSSPLSPWSAIEYASAKRESYAT